jgi:hypothetical protein
LLITGAGASLLLVTPEMLRATPAFAASAISVGFVDTLDPLVVGARVIPGAQVVNDTSLTNRLMAITVGGLHPATDGAFPAASLDALYTQNGSTYPFYAVSHAAGRSTNRVTFSQVPGSTGLRFVLRTGSMGVSGSFGARCQNGLRAGTYLFGLTAKTWAQETRLANDTVQRSLIVVIRRAV